MRGRTPASSRHLPGWAVVVLVLVLATAVGVIALLRPGGSPQDAGPAGAPAAGRTAAGQGALTSTMTNSDLDDVHVSEVVAWPDGGPSRIRLAVREHPELLGEQHGEVDAHRRHRVRRSEVVVGQRGVEDDARRSGHAARLPPLRCDRAHDDPAVVARLSGGPRRAHAH